MQRLPERSEAEPRNAFDVVVSLNRKADAKRPEISGGPTQSTRWQGACGPALGQLSEPQVFAREFADRGTPHQLHSSLDLRPHEAQCSLDTHLASGRQGE